MPEFVFDSAVSSTIAVAPDERMQAMHRYWMAANYLAVGQIFLQDNPLLREALRPEHIKPRLLGHWGTSPGLSLIYVHLNRLIVDHDASIIYLAGPGHGGPAEADGKGLINRASFITGSSCWGTSRHGG